MMKIGFSSMVCPGWDLETVVTKASEYGFDGVELRGLRGELHLPLVPELAGRPDRTRELFAEKHVELVCLGASATLDAKKSGKLNVAKAELAEYIELAGRLGCPFVRLYAGEIQRFDHHRAALGRIADVLVSLVPLAVRHGVTLLVENGGDFSSSRDLWFLVDAVGHPAVCCCWNQCHGLTIGERPTKSIPRLGNKIGFVHVCDARFDEQGVLMEYRRLGEGDAEVARQVDLLKGVLFDRYLMFEWPKLWQPSLPAPDAALPEVAAFLRERIDDKHAVLSAYKNDKNAPLFASRVPAGQA